MENSVRERLLTPPDGVVDAVLDTDTYNEIDDQFALAYMLRSNDKIRTKAVYAAPFFNSRSTSPADGMEKSYQEILNVLHLCGRTDLNDRVFRGSETYLPNEQTPVESPAAAHLAALAESYSAERPLYVIAIGAITNVASALLKNPAMAEKCVLIWLGGHAHHWPDTKEFNLRQDIAAARVVFGSGIPVVQLPCAGVVDSFTISEPELRAWLLGKNPLASYLAQNVIDTFGVPGKCWDKVVWDVTAVAWLINPKTTLSDLRPILLPDYNGLYDTAHPGEICRYVYHIRRVPLLNDLIEKLLR